MNKFFGLILLVSFSMNAERPDHPGKRRERKYNRNFKHILNKRKHLKQVAPSEEPNPEIPNSLKTSQRLLDNLPVEPNPTPVDTPKVLSENIPVNPEPIIPPKAFSEVTPEEPENSDIPARAVKTPEVDPTIDSVTDTESPDYTPDAPEELDMPDMPVRTPKVSPEDIINPEPEVNIPELDQNQPRMVPFAQESDEEPVMVANPNLSRDEMSIMVNNPEESFAYVSPKALRALRSMPEVEDMPPVVEMSKAYLEDKSTIPHETLPETVSWAMDYWQDCANCEETPDRTEAERNYTALATYKQELENGDADICVVSNPDGSEDVLCALLPAVKSSNKE